MFFKVISSIISLILSLTLEIIISFLFSKKDFVKILLKNSFLFSNISKNFFKEKKISISQHTINLIIERSRGNRENLNNELEKIYNYSKSGKKISTEDILNLTNLSENYNVSELTDNCLAKNTKKTSHILNENNFTSEDCILIIRTRKGKAIAIAGKKLTPIKK